MNDNRKRLVNYWQEAICAAATLMGGVAVIPGSAMPVEAAVVVRVSTNDALPGGTLTLEMRLDRSPGDPSVAGAQVDLVLSTAQLQLLGACSSDQSTCENGTACPTQGRCVPTCQASSRLTQHSLAASFPDFQNVASDRRRLRLPINPNLFPPPTLSDGLLLTCSFAVLPGASLGPIELSADVSRFRVTDDASDPVVATLEIEAGAVVAMLATVTATPTHTPPPPSLTPTTEATVTPTETTAATVTPTSEATATHTQEATVTPSLAMTATATMPQLTATASSTPTYTRQVPTATPTLPTATVTSEATVTRTSTPRATFSPTDRPPTSTPTNAARVRKDSDGCSLSAEPPQARGVWALMIAWPVSLVFLRRRAMRGAGLQR